MQTRIHRELTFSPLQIQKYIASTAFVWIVADVAATADNVYGQVVVVVGRRYSNQSLSLKAGGTSAAIQRGLLR